MVKTAEKDAATSPESPFFDPPCGIEKSGGSLYEGCAALRNPWKGQTHCRKPFPDPIPDPSPIHERSLV